MVNTTLAKGLYLSVSRETLIAKKTDSENYLKIPSKYLSGFTQVFEMISKIKDYVFGNPNEEVALLIEPEAYLFIERTCLHNQSSF